MAATATVLGGPGVASASGTEPDGEGVSPTDFEPIPVREFGPGEIQLETLSVAAAVERAAGVRPGSQLFVQREGTTANCTANLVWRDADGFMYVGAAGHCFLPAGAQASENVAVGSETGFDVSASNVSMAVDGTFSGVLGGILEAEVVELGDVVYARQAKRSGGIGIGHDFGLVEVPSEAEELVDPSLPRFGGPTASPGARPRRVPSSTCTAPESETGSCS